MGYEAEDSVGCWTWKEDGGMHQLADRLYQLMAQEGFAKSYEARMGIMTNRSYPA